MALLIDDFEFSGYRCRVDLRRVVSRPWLLLFYLAAALYIGYRYVTHFRKLRNYYDTLQKNVS